MITNNTHFVLYLYKPNKPIFEDLNLPTITRLVYLSTYLNRDGLLADGRKPPMTKSEIINKMNLSRCTVHPFFQKLIEKNILIQTPEGFTISNRYLYRGINPPFISEDDVYTTKIFSSNVRTLYSALDPNDHKHFGYVFKFIPYINREYNIICSNPLESDITQIMPLRLTDMCGMLEYDKNNVKRLERALSKNKFHAKGFEQDGGLIRITTDIDNNTFITVNPQIYYGGRNIKNIEVLGLF